MVSISERFMMEGTTGKVPSICILFLLLLQFNPLNAQQMPTDSTPFLADLSITGLYQGGNVETVIFRTSGGVRYRFFQDWVFRTHNSYVYQEFGRSKADKDILSLNFLYFNPDRRLYPQVLGFISTNFRRRIDWRYLTGVGMTYKLLEEKKNFLKFSLSCEYERTRYDQLIFNNANYNGKRYLSTLRGTLWVNGRYHIVKNKIIFCHESYYQPSLEQSDNYRWRADLSLEFPIWKYVNLKVNYLHTHESIVVAEQLRDDSMLTFGFAVKSYE